MEESTDCVLLVPLGNLVASYSLCWIEAIGMITNSFRAVKFLLILDGKFNMYAKFMCGVGCFLLADIYYFDCYIVKNGLIHHS